MMMRLATLLTLATFSLLAQNAVDDEATERKSTPGRVVERGPHHRVVETVTRRVTPFGREYFVTNAYTELRTGMHYADNGEWKESRNTIEVFPDGAIARQGAHQVIWSPNLNVQGAVDLLTPDGKRFRSHILGLAYTDAISGKSVLIAEPKDCIGEVVGNQVIYRDAFAGPFRADVRYTYTESGISQDILIREVLPSPLEYDLSAERSRIEVWTEFIDASEPVKGRSVLKAEASTEARQVMVDPDMTDETLDFGAMRIGSGSAFPLDAPASDEFNSESAPVGKNWIQLEGRTFLIEKTDLRDIREKINQLPKSASVNGTKEQRQASVRKGSSRETLLAGLPVPERREAKAGNGTMRTALVMPPEKGFVLDYSMVSTATNFTFQSDTTYFISGNVTLSGTTVVESAVIKYTNGNSTARLIIQGPVVCRTDSHRPVIFTAKDDDTVGDIIASSTGHPTNSANYGYFLDITGNTNVIDLHNVRMRRGRYGVNMGSTSRLLLRNAQISSNYAGVVISSGEARLRNVLMHDTVYAYGGGGTNNWGEHVTYDRISFFRSANSSSYQTMLTNSLVVGVISNIVYTGTAVVTNASNSGYFQTVGQGQRYLAGGSTNRNAGTTNINPDLLEALKTRTTYPPTVLANLNASTNLSPVVERDVSQPDIGYHYDVLDYLVGGVAMTNVTLTVTNGANIGLDASQTNYGIRLGSGASVISEGSPTNFNRFVRSLLVQEIPTGNSVVQTPLFADTVPIPGSATTFRARFTDFPALPDSYLFRQEWGNGTLINLHLRDSHVRGGRITLFPSSSNCVATVTNCLLDRVNLFVYEYAQGKVHAFNNLFRGGTNYLEMRINSVWDWRNNLFDRSGIYQYIFGTFNHSHNGYVNGYWRLTPTNASDMVLTASPAYDTNATGLYYLPSNFSLINTGNTSAASLGLYHYTTTTNQVKETNSTVDIGLHYVALDSTGAPVDSDADGVPDFVEDSNGNGVLDNGETCFHDPVLAVASSLNYIKGSPPKLLDPTATVTDPGSPDFSGGRLIVTTVTGAEGNDRVAVRHQGSSPGQIGISGTNITYGGITVGTWSGGSGTNALSAVFNTNATPVAVQALVRNLTFNNISNSPATSIRALKFDLTDGDGGTNVAEYMTVNVICPQAIDAFLVIDVSNSMPDEDFPTAKQAASNFVSHLQLSLDKVGLVSFAGFAYLDSALTNNGSSVQAKIMGLTNISGTTFHYALDLARSNLTSTASNVLPLVVLLSDGKVGTTNGASNPPQSQIDTNTLLATNAAIALKDAGVRLITIAYGTVGGANNGTNLMKLFASSTNDFYYSPTISVVDSNFTVIAQGICRGGPPSVAIAIPTNSQFYPMSPTNILVSAVATDPDVGGSITNVEFYAGSTKLDFIVSVSNSTYSIDWNPVSGGTYSLSARATDETGLVSTSAVVSITVNLSPTATITAPADNAIYLFSPTNLTLSATAADSDGTVSKVEFYHSGSVKIGEDSGSPYSLVWSNPAFSSYALTAVAVDDFGLRGTSSVVNVHIWQVPFVSIVTPTNGESFLAPARISMTSMATDADGVITNVSYYNGGVLVGRSAISPFRLEWMNVMSGNYSLTAVATDNTGLTNGSGTVTISVAKRPPSVTLLTPVNGTTNAVNEPVILEADASDADGTIGSVVFYDGATPLWTNTTPPYRATITNLTAGVHTFKARATDNDALWTDSGTASVRLENCAAASLVSLSLNPGTASAGESIVATLTLNSPAMAGGQTVRIISDNPLAVPPPTVLVSNGETSVDFVIETIAGTNQGLVGLSASYHGQTVTNQMAVIGATGVPPLAGPMDVAFVLDTTFTMGAAIENLRAGITNLVDRIEEASGGDYQAAVVVFDGGGNCANCPAAGHAFLEERNTKVCDGDFSGSHDYVCVRTNFFPGNRLAITEVVKTLGTNDANGLAAPDASDEALRSVIHRLKDDKWWRVGDFRPGFTRDAKRVIVLVTDSLPGGFTNNYTSATREFALGLATNAFQSNIVICAVQVGTDTNVADLMWQYAQLTGGAYVQTPQDGSGLSTAIARFFAPYGDAGGSEVVVRSDGSGQQGVATIEASGNWTNSLGLARFDLRSLFGDLQKAEIQREGTLRLDRGQRFDLEVGIGSSDGSATSFGWWAADAQVLGSPTNYSVGWWLPADIRADISGYFGNVLSLPLVDRWSSICGGGTLATDTPQEGFPLLRNELALVIQTTRSIPLGHSRDLILSQGSVPLNGWWDITLRGTVVASSGLPRGWDVEPDQTQFGGFHVTVPTNAVTGVGYEVRVQLPGWSNGQSAHFEVVSSDLLTRAPSMLPLVLSTNVVTSSTGVELKIRLDEPAPAGGAHIVLKTSGLANPGLPAWVVIPAGETLISTNFTQSTGTTGQLEIVAAYNGYRKSSLRVVNCAGVSVGTIANLSSSTNGDIITLTWDAASSATSYKVEHRTGTSGSWNTVFTGLTTNRFVDPDAAPPTTNQYRVYAVNDCASSAAASIEQVFLYSFLPPAPVVIPNQGTFHDFVTVIVTNSLAGSTIHYSTNGVIPDGDNSGSFFEGGALEVTGTANLRAFTAHASFSQPSRHTFARYVIQPSVEVNCGDTNNSALKRTNAWSTILGPGFYSSRYWFNGTSNDVMDIRVASTNFDTFLLLMDANTNLLAFNDDAARGVTDSRIFTQIPSNGTYFIEVSSYSPEETGKFTLTTECVGFPEIRVADAAGTNLPTGTVIEMGVTNAGANLLSRTLTISNAGTATLTLTNYVLTPTNFHVAQPSPPDLAPGATQTLTVKLTNNLVGEFFGRLEIISDDSELEDGIENPFVLFLHGRVDPAPAPPVVSILFPTNGMVIPDAPVNTEIVAVAADADGIKKVEFYVGATLLTTVTTPPYRTNWSNVGANTYTLTAKAYDSNNVVTTSSAVAVTIGKPTVTLAQSAPCVGKAGVSQRTLTATVTDATGAPANGTPVTFVVSGANAQTQQVTANISGQATFNYTGTLPGYDRVTASATVSSINITSTETNLSWAGVTNCTPMNGTLSTSDGPSIGCQCSTFARYADFYRFTANAGQTVTFRLSSFDFEPLFFIMNSSTCQVLATNYVLSSSNALRSFVVPSTGDYFVEVTSIGLYETGAYTLEVECGIPNAAPNLDVFVDGSPIQNGAVIDFGTTTVSTPVDATVILSNAGNAILYFTNMIVPGDFSGATPPATLAAGATHSFTLQFDASVAGQRTAPFTINSGDPDEQPFVLNLTAIANPAGSPPVVSLTTPAANAVYSAPATIALEATASASGGAVITNLEFILVTAETNYLVWRDTNAPYTGVLNTDVPGSYTLAAAAMDSLGRLTVSPPVTVEVRPLILNRPPAATNDNVEVAANSANNTLYLLANDADPDLDELAIIEIIPANTQGIVEIVDAGKAVRYTPPRGVKGNPADGFYYKVTDGKGGIATAKVQVAVEASDVPSVVILKTLAPANGIAVCIGTNAHIQVQVTPWQNVTNVEVYFGAARIAATNSGANGLYTLQWTAFSENCICGLTAAAFDRFGQRGVTTEIVPIEIERCGNTTPPVARIDNLVPVARKENNYNFNTTPTIQQGFFTIQGAAYHTTNGVPVSYAILLLSTDGAVLRDLTPAPLVDGFHSGSAGGLSATGVLASCDLTTLENGVYDLQLLVRGGVEQTNATVRFILDSELKLGPFGFTEQDLVIPVNGLPLTVLRTYNSLNPRSGDFGYSWTYSLVDLQVVLDEERTDVFALDDEGPGLAGAFSLRTGGGRNVTLTLPDGRRTTFYFDFTPVPGSEKLSLAPIWHSAPGVNAKLEVNGHHQYEPLLRRWQGDANTAYDWYEFPGWTLTTEDGTQFVIERDQTGAFALLAEENPLLDLGGTTSGEFNATTYGPPKLSKIAQRSGDEIRIQRERTDSDRRRRFNIDHVDGSGQTNKSIVVERDSLNRIAAISDPLGQNGSGQPSGPAAVKYEYDGSGNLSKVLRLVDRAANGGAGSYLTNRYYYEHSRFPHYLTRIEDARGVAVARNLYDDSGKLIGVIDAAGRTNRFDHDIEGRRELTYDRLGNETQHFYDERGNVTRTINALGESTTRQYDANNYLVEEVNARLETNRFAYDGQGNRIGMTNALGHVSSSSFNGTARLLTAVDPLGRGVTNTYDARDNLALTVNALGQANSFLYDSRGLLVSQVDALGQVVSNQYNANGWVTNTATYTNTIGGLIASTAFFYDGNGNRTNETLVRVAAGVALSTNVTTSVYDALNRLTLSLDALGRSNRTVYDAAGRVASTFDALDRETIQRYDARGLLTNITYPDLSSENYAYDGEGRRTNSMDRLGRSTAYFYDELGRMTRMVYPDGATQSTAFDEAGRVAYTVDARGVTNAFGYDAAGRRVAVTNALGTMLQQVTRSEFDAAGNLLTTADGTGRFVEHEYDALNRRVRTLWPPSAPGLPRPFTATAYDAAGRRVFETNEAGVVSQFVHDALGRMTGVTNALGLTEKTFVAYTYDSAGNLTAESRYLRTTKFEYDNMGRRVRRELPGTSNPLSDGFRYDLAGNLAAHTNFTGQVITNHYDVMNRLVGVWHGSTQLVAYVYSTNGLRTVASNEAGMVTWVYDTRDRVRTNSTPAGTLQYDYDIAGNLTNLVSTTAGGVRMGYAHDALGRLTNVTDAAISAPNQSAYRYDTAGNLIRFEQPNGVTHQWRHDSRHRLTNLTVTTSLGFGTVIGRFDYALASTGQRTQLVEQVDVGSRTFTWQHDALHRLTNDIVTGAAPTGAVAYVYDLAHNRTKRTSTSALNGILTNQVFNFDYKDRLDTNTIPSDANLLYDANGNPTNLLGNVYQYDWADRLTNAVVGGATVSLAYDADGNRLRKTVGTTNTLYLVSTMTPSGYAQVLEEKSVIAGVTNLTKTYTYGLDLISQRESGGTVYYFAVDGLGSTRVLTDSSATVANAFAYDAYGNLIASNSAPQTLYLFAGEQWDPHLRLYFNRARYLDPGTGRFLNRDTFEGNNEDPISLHKYLYCHADPVNRIDPSGLKFTRAESAAIGREVHKRIGEHFMRTTPFGERRVTAQSVFTMLKLPNPPSGGAINGISRLFPDLVDLTHKEVYEIKPISIGGTATGAVQLGGYVLALNQLDPTGGWGVAIGPQHYNSFQVFFTAKPFAAVTVFPPVFGMIFYEAVTPSQFATKRAMNVATANMARLQQHMGMATLLGLLGGI